MARKPAATPHVADEPTLSHEALATAGRALTTLSQEALAIKDAFGLASMDPGALEEQLRVWVDHTSRSMFMVGAHLVALRAVTATGEWLLTLGRCGIAPRAAQKFMQAAGKCLGADGPRERVLQLERSKVLELVTLDDEQLDELERTGGIEQLRLQLDEIDRMSASQLRERLREREGSMVAKDRLLATKDKKLNALTEQIERPFQPSGDDAARNAEEQALMTQMRDCIVAVEAAFAQLGVMARRATDGSMNPAVTLAASQNLTYLAQRAAEVLSTAGVDVDFTEMVTPTWVTQAKAKHRKA
jgi:hypothetical protein